MGRSRPSAIIATLLVALHAISCSRDLAPKVVPPRHVLLLTIDTVRSDYLSCSGYDRPTTPFLDSLIARGVHFPNTLATVPRTTPALASLLTGEYPHDTGVRTLYDSLAADAVTIAERFQEEGYATIGVVSNHVLVPERRLDQGFEIYDAADDSRGAFETNEALLEHLRGYDRDTPLFVWVHYIDPHVPYLPPAELAEEFDPGYDGRYALGFGPADRKVGSRAYPEDLPKIEAVYKNRLAPRLNEHIRRLYAAEIRAVDDEIRRLHGELVRGFGDEWLIVFTSDHGESLGEHRFYYDHGDYAYTPSLRVPLAIVLPAGATNVVPRQLPSWVSHVDVAPTIWELMGFSGPLPGAGVSLLPAISGGELVSRPVFAESGVCRYPNLLQKKRLPGPGGRFRTVIHEGHALVWNPGGGAGKELELYDLRADLLEERNIATLHPEKAEELRGLLSKWVREEAGSVAPMSETDRERLRSLGYIE